jgi:hypothetical protein
VHDRQDNRVGRASVRAKAVAKAETTPKKTRKERSVGIAAAVATLAGYTSGLLYRFSLRVYLTGLPYGFTLGVLFTGLPYGFTLRVLYPVPLFGQFTRNYYTHILSIYMGPVAR